MQNYRLKLNYDKCYGIHSLIYTMLELYKPENIPEDLVDDFMKEIMYKMMKKIDAKHVTEWSITLNHKEAKAYYTFFSRTQAIPSGFEFELNIIRQHLTDIDREFAPRRSYTPQLASGQQQLQRHG